MGKFVKNYSKSNKSLITIGYKCRKLIKNHEKLLKIGLKIDKYELKRKKIEQKLQKITEIYVKIYLKYEKKTCEKSLKIQQKFDRHAKK